MSSTDICLSMCHVSLALVCFISYLSNHFTDTHDTLEHDEHLGPYERSHCDDLRQSGGLTQTIIPSGYEPKIIETNVIDSEAISPADFEPRRIELDRNLATDPYQIHEVFVRSSLTGDMEEFRKVGADVSYFPSQMHSDCDSAESIADSDLEDGELRKMLASPLYLQNREDYESFRMPIATAKLGALLQERGASAKRAQAGWRKGLGSSSSQEPSAPAKAAALFSSGTKEPGNQLKSSVFGNASPSNLGRSLLESSKDQLLSQARSERMRQEHQVGSLNNRIIEFQQQSYAQRLELQDAQHGFF